MITILNIDKFIKENKLMGPVTSSQLFTNTKNYEFHPLGLISEDLFGLDGTRDRTVSFSWIDLNCRVIHPVLYDLLTKRIEKKISDALTGEHSFDLDPVEGLVLNKDNKGKIRGFRSLYEHIQELRFRDSGEGEERSKLINVLYKNIDQGTFFMDRLLVISPNFREVTVDLEKNEIVVHDLTRLYQRIIILSSQMKSVSGLLYDTLTFRMQRLVRELYELVRTVISKKQGMIRNLMLGKRVDFSARSVIVPNPHLQPQEVGLPVRICVQSFEPFVIYGLVNSRYANSIPDEFHLEARKFLGKEESIVDDYE